MSQYNTAAAPQARAIPAALENEEKVQLNTISAEDAQTYIETQRTVASQKYQEQNTQKFNSLFPKEKQGFFRSVPQKQPEVLYSCRYAPNILMELTKGQINQAACSSEVEGIYYCDEMQQDPFSWMDEASQISTAAAAAGSISLTYQTITGAKEMRDAYNYTGEGVKVGILEGAVPDKTNPVFAHMFHAGNPQADRFHIVKQTNNTESGHVTSVAAIIAAETEKFSAIAPDVDLYCAGVQDAVTGAIRWKEGMEALLDAGVNIINASYSLIGDTWGEYGDSSRWVDHVIWEHNVSVCIGSGNNRNVISGAMAYNAITVGNIDDQKTLNLSDDKRYDKWYSGIHYQSAYSDSTSFACKPDIMAPGARAGTPVNPMQSTKDDYGGTSYAAPIVVGILVQLLEMKPVYKALPVALKTALLAGAVKTQEMIDCDEDVDPDNDIDSVKYGDRIALDRKNGAGMVNVLQAAEILESGQLFYHPNFGGNTKIIQVQFSAHGGDRLQICLNWLKPSIITGPHITTDALDIVQEHLRLSVYNSNGTLLYSSDLLSDTKQYIAFTPAKADTYIFKAEKISNQSNGVPVTLSWYQN